MSDESPKRLVPWPCASCGRPSVAQVGLEGGIYVHVCLDHYHVHEEQRMRKIQMYRQLAEDAEDQMADVFGLPRKQRPMQIPAPRVNVNQVNVSGDNLGIINTGTANNIANNLTIIHGQDANFADQLKNLTSAILASPSLDATQKRNAVELLNELIENEAKPQEQRRSGAVMKTIGAGLGAALSHVDDLHKLWTWIAPHLGL